VVCPNEINVTEDSGSMQCNHKINRISIWDCSFVQGLEFIAEPPIYGGMFGHYVQGPGGECEQPQGNQWSECEKTRHVSQGDQLHMAESGLGNLRGGRGRGCLVPEGSR